MPSFNSYLLIYWILLKCYEEKTEVKTLFHYFFCHSAMDKIRRIIKKAISFSSSSSFSSIVDYTKRMCFCKEAKAAYHVHKYVLHDSQQHEIYKYSFSTYNNYDIIEWMPIALLKYMYPIAKSKCKLNKIMNKKKKRTQKSLLLTHIVWCCQVLMCHVIFSIESKFVCLVDNRRILIKSWFMN